MRNAKKIMKKLHNVREHIANRNSLRN